MSYTLAHIHTLEYYSDIKKNEIMSLAGKWMELKIMLHEISQTKKNKYCMFSLIVRMYT
jgi:hypothetical protein